MMNWLDPEVTIVLLAAGHCMPVTDEVAAVVVVAVVVAPPTAHVELVHEVST